MDMQDAGLVPDPITLTDVISACACGHLWSHALHMLEHMRCLKQTPNVLAYNAAICATSEAGHWEQSLHLLRYMRSLEVVPDAMNYFAAIRAMAAQSNTICAQ